MDRKHLIHIGLALVAVLALGCASKSAVSTTVDCPSPTLVTASLQSSGLPTSQTQPNEFKGAGSVLRLTTPTCTGVWLGLDAGPIHLAILGAGQLPSVVDAALPATPSDCLPAGVGSPVAIPGYTTLSGSVKVSVEPGAFAGAVLSLTSTDLVVEDKWTHVQSKVTFTVNASFPVHCATLVKGSLALPSAWGVGYPPAGGVTALGQCSSPYATWQGLATPATPPFVCAAAAGSQVPVADAGSGYDGVGDGL
jgi:hypothetical protein